MMHLLELIWFRLWDQGDWTLILIGWMLGVVNASVVYAWMTKRMEWKDE